MVDPQAVDEPLANEPERQRVGRLEHLRILLAHAGEVVDVEEAPVAPARRVDVEEALAQLLVAPEAVRSSAAMWFGTDVEHDPEAGATGRGGEREERLLAAERVREPGRVDHVVAVRRAGAGLERRRQVEVPDAEVAQIRDQHRERRSKPNSAVSCRR